MFCCTLLSVHSSIAIILMGKRELVALLWGCLPYVIVVFPDHNHFLFLVPLKYNLALQAAVRSKAVVMLLLIHCLLFFPLFVGVLCSSCFVIQYLGPFFWI